MKSALSRDSGSGSGSGSLSPLCNIAFPSSSSQQNRTWRSAPDRCCSQADQQSEDKSGRIRTEPLSLCCHGREWQKSHEVHLSLKSSDFFQSVLLILNILLFCL